MGTGNHGDAARWVRDRRKFHDSVDDAIDQYHEERRMELTQLQAELQDRMRSGDPDGKRFMLIERVGCDQLRVFLTRSGNTKGYDEVLLKIVEEK